MSISKSAIKQTFNLITCITMLAAIYTIFVYAPVEKTMGLVQKIFYLHLPAAFMAFGAFFITFLTSTLYLIQRNLKWDRIASGSAEVGVIFCTIVLITGPLWAKPIWNVWWTWDPRLTTTLILWFIYLAYLMLRGVVRENQQANLCAVFGIIGFVSVPITFLAIRLWRTIHPVIITPQGINVSAPIKLTLIISFCAFVLLFITLLISRVELEKLRMKTEELRDRIENEFVHGQ